MNENAKAMRDFGFFVFLIRKNVRILDTTKTMLTFIG